MSKIVTTHRNPPITEPQWTWSACREGQEETGNYGWGETEEQAIADLLRLETEAEEAEEAEEERPSP